MQFSSRWTAKAQHLLDLAPTRNARLFEHAQEGTVNALILRQIIWLNVLAVNY
jgi:hypothetical protein